MLLSTTTRPHDDVPRLAAALQRAEARIRELKHENSALRTELCWIDRLLAVPASIMSPSQKVTLRAAVKAYQQGTPDDNGLVQIQSWKLCKTVGQSKQTFLENPTYCAEQLGILTKKRERLVESETHDYTTNLYIGVTPRLPHPQQYQVEQPRNHGGERQRCPHCHSDRLQKKVTVTCMACGTVLDEAISLVNQGSHLDLSPIEHARDSGETQNSERHVSLTISSVNPACWFGFPEGVVGELFNHSSTGLWRFDHQFIHSRRVFPSIDLRDSSDADESIGVALQHERIASERTLFRWPSCVARKMRCLRLRTVRLALRQLRAFQLVCVLVPFAEHASRI